MCFLNEYELPTTRGALVVKAIPVAGVEDGIETLNEAQALLEIRDRNHRTGFGEIGLLL